MSGQPGTPQLRGETKKQKKGNAMIKRKECFESGALGNLTINDVQEYVRCRLRESIMLCDTPKLETLDTIRYSEWLNELFCKKKTITLNDKNVEYSENFWMVHGWGCDAEFQRGLTKYDISDINVELIIYRIGSYSYWAAICCATTGNEPCVAC